MGRQARPRALLWVALAAGFAASNHRTGFLIVGPSLPFVFWLTKFRRRQQVRGWVKALALFAAPFLCYLYLPIRAAAHPVRNWTDPETWDRFWDHVLARQYERYAFMNDWEHVKISAAELWHDGLAPGWTSYLLVAIAAAFAAWGFVSWIRRRPVVVGTLSGAAAFVVVFTLGYGAPTDNTVYLIPVGIVLALLAGPGCGATAGEDSDSRWRAMAPGRVDRRGVACC